MKWRAIAVLSAWALLETAGLGGQARAVHRRRTRPRPAHAAPAAPSLSSRYLFTAEADLRDRAYDSAARAFAAVLQLEPGNATARQGLAQARDAACHAEVDQAAAGAQWARAAARLRGCLTPEAASVQRFERLDAIQTDLARHAWAAAAAQMRQLGSTPPALQGSLAPAYAAFGAGEARATARLLAQMAAQTSVHPANAVSPDRVAAFQAFLRNRARQRGWRAAALPLLALYLLALGAGLYWGLRGLLAPEGLA